MEGEEDKKEEKSEAEKKRKKVYTLRKHLPNHGVERGLQLATS